MSAVQFKQPNGAPTEKQVAFYNTLAAERGLPTIEAFAPGITRKQASEAIDAVKALAKAEQVQANQIAAIGGDPTAIGLPKPSLTALAAEILGQPAPAPKPPRPEFTNEELAALRAALSVCIGETDGTPVDHELYVRIDAYLKAAS